MKFSNDPSLCKNSFLVLHAVGSMDAASFGDIVIRRALDCGSGSCCWFDLQPNNNFSVGYVVWVYPVSSKEKLVCPCHTI